MKNVNNSPIIMNNLVKGMAKMTQQRSVEHYIDSLIRENKKSTADGYSLFVEDLHPADQEEFLAYLLEAEYLDKDSFEWLFDSKDKHELSVLFSHYLKAYGSNRDLLEKEFLKSFKDEAIKAYLPRMQDLVEYRMGWVEWADREERKYPDESAFL